MKGARLFVLLSSLWSGGFGLITTQPWTTPEDENSQKNITSAWVPLNKTRSLQVLPTSQIMSVEIAHTREARSSEKTLLKSMLMPSERSLPPESVRNQTLTPTGKTEDGVLKLQTLALPTKPSVRFSTGAESVVLSNATLTFLQSFARKSNQQAISLNSDGGTGNRTSRETYLSRGDNSGSQKNNYQKSSFETTRGK